MEKLRKCIEETTIIHDLPYSTVEDIITKKFDMKTIRVKKNSTKEESTNYITSRNRKEAEEALSDFGITITGLRPGEIIIGLRTITKGCIMSYRAPLDNKNVCDFIVPPRKKELDYLRNEPDLWSLFMEKLNAIKFFEGMSDKQKETWLNTNESSKDLDISELGGEIEILQLGDSDLVEKLLPETLEELITKGWMKASNLREIIPGKPGTNARRHTLFFLRWFWSLSLGIKRVKECKCVAFDVNSGKIYQNGIILKDEDLRAISIFEEDDTKFGIVTNISGVKLNIENIKKIALEYIKNDLSLEFNDPSFLEFEENDYNAIINTFELAVSKFTAASYKSLLQKIIRYRPKYINFEVLKSIHQDPIISKIKAEIVLVLCIAYLFANPGSFVPDIQRFVSGPESATKRIVISIYEESCFGDDDATDIFRICLAAYLFQRTQLYQPTQELINLCFSLAIRKMRESHYIAYEGDRISELLKYEDKLTRFTIENISFNKKNATLKAISFFSDKTKSFALDLLMMRWCANFPKGTSQEWSKFPKNKIRPKEMVFEHCIDHHWAPEIALFYSQQTLIKIDVNKICKNTLTKSKPFSALFSELFHKVTGFNPRKNETIIDESSPFIKESRNCQKLVFFSKNSNRNHKTIFLPKDEIISYVLDKSWIAGMLGSIVVNGKPPVLVTLHPTDTETFVVVRRPSRDIKSEKDAILSPQREKDAIKYVKNLLSDGYPLRCATAPIPELKKAKLILEDDKFYISSKITKKPVLWDELRSTSQNIHSYKYESRSFDDIIITRREEGVCSDWEKIVINLMKKYDIKEINRVLTYLKGYASEFEINRISRDGGGTKYSVVREDIGAYKFIVELSDIIPSGISRRTYFPLIFDVINGPVLWQIRDYIEMNLSLISKNEELDEIHWKLKKIKYNRTLYPHQQDILNVMQSRYNSGKKNHFINATVGSGKTMVVMEYFRWLILKNEFPSYVIYTLPTSSIGSIIQECEMMGFKIILIDPRKTIPKNAQFKDYRKKVSQIEKGYICLIEHDHLRRCENELLEIASNSKFVIDEIHKTLNETKRTSIALNISRLSQEVIGLTGTPIIDTNTYKLIWWLVQINDFEVNEKNFWVASNSMISKKYDTGIEVIRTNKHIEMSNLEKKEYSKYVSVKMGGKNLQPTPSDFSQALKICYSIVTRGIVREVINSIDKGGVFIVSKNIDHSSEIKTELIKNGILENDIFIMSSGDSIYLTDDAVKRNDIHDFKVVITTTLKSEGYSLTRLKTMVKSEYPSNNATREQLEGRINRIGQKAKSIKIITVHTGILTHILMNHYDAWTLSTVFSQLADVFK